MSYGVDGLTMSEEIARRMEGGVRGTALQGFLDTAAVLVPMPRAGLMTAGALWPARSA